MKKTASCVLMDLVETLFLLWTTRPMATLLARVTTTLTSTSLSPTTPRVSVATARL